MSPYHHAVGWMVFSCFFLAVLAVTVRTLLDSVSPFLILPFQQWFSFLLLLPYFLRKRIWLPKTGQMKWYMLRGLFGISSFLLAILSMLYLPLADVTAIGYVAPLLTVLLASIVLKELFTRHLLYALTGGLIGVLVVIRPTGDVVLIGVLLVLGSAALKAIVGLMIKCMSGRDDIRTLLFYTVFFSSLWSTPFFFLFWEMPNPQEWSLLLLAGAATICFHFGFIRACYLSPLIKLMPYEFTTQIFVTALAFIILGEAIDMVTLCGAAIILGSSIFALRQEKRLHARTI